MNSNIILCSIVIGMMVMPSFVFSQALKLNQADRYYEDFQFQKALKLYHKVLDNNPEHSKSIIRIADIHRMLDHYKKANKWYSKVVELEEVQPKHYYFYAQALRSNQKYQKAAKYYQAYAKLAPYDSRALELAESCQNISSLYEDSLKHAVHKLPINTNKPDFSPAYYRNDSIVFVSGRSESKAERKDIWYDAPFLDLYVMDSKGTYSTPKPIKGDVNQRFHEGPLAFTDSMKSLYFTRNNLQDKNKDASDGIMDLNIYHAAYKKGEWTDIEALPINSDEYSEGHPTFSEDGDTMYFASDMEGTQGKLDIWRAVKNDGEWSEPVNLGDTINTRGNEHFPFYHPSGKLFYASEGMPGLGGLDVYFSTKKGKKWSEPINMGYPVNSHLDDFGLIVNKEETKGYFSSNRKGGAGQDDIYAFSYANIVKGLVYDKSTERPLSLVKVDLKHEGDTLGSRTIENDDGNFSFSINEGQEYTIAADKEYYKPATKSFSTKNLDTNVVHVEIAMEKAGNWNLAGTVVNNRTRQPIDSAKVVLANRTDQDTVSMKTSTNGRFSFPLKRNENYQLMARKRGYFMSEPIGISTKGMTKPQTIDTIIELEPLVQDAIINLENIYFDLDKWDITPEAATALNKLVNMMKKYPEMRIEMRSHTDSRGSNAYNLNLSQKRAKSTANYVIKRGIAEERIEWKGFGETNLVNECRDGVDCSEAKHQQNRRTEFRVIKAPQENVSVDGTTESSGQDEYNINSDVLTSAANDKNVSSSTGLPDEQVDKDKQAQINQTLTKGYYAVLGVFKQKKNAQEFMNEQKSEDFQANMMMDNRGRFRVVHYLHEEESSAKNKIEKLKSRKGANFWLMKHEK